MRKLLSILLLAVFSLLPAAPLFALGTASDTGLLACCRRNGAHHCAMTMQEQEGAPQAGTASQIKPARVQAPAPRCPYCPRALAMSHRDHSVAAIYGSLLVALRSDAFGMARAETSWRISRERSRYKRGPPTA